MFAVGWLELGEAEKAQQELQKCFKNIQGPFQVRVMLIIPAELNYLLLSVTLCPINMACECVYFYF